MKYLHQWIVASMLVTGLSGCIQSTPTEEIFNENAPSMADIYFGNDSSQNTEQWALGDGSDNSPYTRSVANETSKLFPRQNNPELVMYVYPHIKNDLPIPGYGTTFPMYNQAVIYALPGERVGDMPYERKE